MPATLWWYSASTVLITPSLLSLVVTGYPLSSRLDHLVLHHTPSSRFRGSHSTPVLHAGLNRLATELTTAVWARPSRPSPCSPEAAPHRCGPLPRTPSPTDCTGPDKLSIESAAPPRLRRNSPPASARTYPHPAPSTSARQRRYGEQAIRPAGGSSVGSPAVCSTAYLAKPGTPAAHDAQPQTGTSV